MNLLIVFIYLDRCPLFINKKGSYKTDAQYNLSFENMYYICG